MLLLIVGDQIRPEVALLAEVVSTAPSLEFALGLVEIQFYHLREDADWPLLAVPAVVGRTHDVTRAVIKVRYEQVMPEIDVSAFEDSPSARRKTDRETFLKSLPRGLDDVFAPYLDHWSLPPYILYWGEVGFSLRLLRDGKPVTVVDAYPQNMSVFMEKWLPEWGNPADAYRVYRSKVDEVPECLRMYVEGKRYAAYDRMTVDDVQLVW
jgi:hypothetical protein